MGQTNSVPFSRCSYHHLSTGHSEEGYCAECDKRFSSRRGKDLTTEKYKKAKVLVSFIEKSPDKAPEKVIHEIYNKSRESVEYEETPRESEDSAAIHRCFHCARFFTSNKELRDHLEPIMNVADRHMSFRFAQERYFCATCDTTYLCSSAEHLRAVHMHESRILPLTKSERAFERLHDCCIPCGVYFTSPTRHEMHMQDVGRHASLLRRSPSLSSSSSSSSSHDFPTTPGPIAPPATSAFTDSPFSVILDFPEPPSLLNVPGPFRPKWLLPPHLGTVSESKTGEDNINDRKNSEEEEFECPLCLDNDENVAKLPCGHIFGAACILKTLAADQRCPICRNPTSMKNVHRLFAYP